jgi:hypothetical protein
VRTVTARINGSLIGELAWTGWGRWEETVTFPHALLADGPNELALSTSVPPGAPLGFFYLDRFTISHPRLLQAHGGELLLTSAGEATLTVGELPAPDPWVLDLSDPGSIAAVTDLTVTGNGPWEVSWLPRPGSDRFWIGDRGTAGRSPEWVIPDLSVRLGDSRNSADLLVVSTPPLLEALEPLLARRESEGLVVARVDIQDVYDEFNAGLASPRALERFLQRMAEVWTVVPRYVLLGGAGTFDFRDHLGLGGNPVPPLLARTPDGLFSTDSMLGDVSGDGIPDLAVGRIPARSVAEMALYVEKILRYEDAAATDRVLLLADRSDGAADFGADAQALREGTPAADVALILRDELSLEEARQQLFDALQAGVGLLHYSGHGGIGQLGQDAILSSADADGLRYGPMVPVVVAPTCVANRHELPTVPSLGEALVLAPHGGAAAVLAASGLSQYGTTLGLSREWLSRSWPAPAEGRLGDLLLDALAAAAAQGTSPEAFRTYTLLGDPTLRVPAIPE